MEEAGVEDDKEDDAGSSKRGMKGARQPAKQVNHPGFHGHHWT